MVFQQNQPCTAGPPFTVGDGTKGSSVLPAQPGQKNRFYDFHRTRSNSSLLHDPTRNPTGMNSCTMICKQSYACGGTVIGSFTITRTFTKGKYQGKDVTLVSIAKTRSHVLGRVLGELVSSRYRLFRVH